METYRHMAHCATLALLTVLATRATRAQDCDASLSLGSASAIRGEVVAVELRGHSLCEVTGFGLAIGHDPSRLSYRHADAGQFLIDHAGVALELLEAESDALGFMTLGVIFDFSPFLTIPPTTIPEGTVLATLEYRILAGAPEGQTSLRNETLTFAIPGFPPFANVFTTSEMNIHPTLGDGSITILPEPPPFVRGDVNSDGNRDLSDVVAILSHLFAGAEAPPCVKAADSDDDGVVNVTDAVHLLNFLFDGGPALATPFPECGTDQTPDELSCVSFPRCQ